MKTAARTGALELLLDNSSSEAYCVSVGKGGYSVHDPASFPAGDAAVQTAYHRNRQITTSRGAGNAGTPGHAVTGCPRRDTQMARKQPVKAKASTGSFLYGILKPYFYSGAS